MSASDDDCYQAKKCSQEPIKIVESNKNGDAPNGLESKTNLKSRSEDLNLKNNNLRFNNSPEYLAQLLSDKKKLQSFPALFVHLEKLLDEEISQVRRNLFHLNPNTISQCLPEPVGSVVTLSKKLTIPVNEYPDYNFVGRILGPRGRTAKQLEQDMDCKIMIRGKGSMRNSSKQDLSKTKHGPDHLNEDLHILITVEDTENRAKLKLQVAVLQVKKLLVPAPEGEDSLKKKQLMELAIINGTYRETKSSSSPSSLTPSLSSLSQLINGSQIFARAPIALHRTQTGLLSPPPPNNTQIILTQARLPISLPHSQNGGVLGGCISRTSVEGQSLIGSSFLNGLDTQGRILVQLDHNPLMQSTFIDLGYPLDTSQAGPLRRGKLCTREQPYMR